MIEFVANVAFGISIAATTFVFVVHILESERKFRKERRKLKRRWAEMKKRHERQRRQWNAYRRYLNYEKN